MDYRYLDPRRPLRAKATPEEAEERLLPYSPLLPFAPLSYASQDRVVTGLRGVAAAPAGLESTTLVLAVRARRAARPRGGRPWGSHRRRAVRPAARAGRFAPGLKQTSQSPPPPTPPKKTVRLRPLLHAPRARPPL
jgi:hypothetical protein